MKKLTDIEKLKYWIDTEFTILHIMFAIVMLELTEGSIWNIILITYIIFSVFYILIRLAFIAASDPDYLRIPKR